MGYFSGKTVLITGASSGIGEALAYEFARQGGDVVLAARRVDRLEKVAEEVRRIGRFAFVFPCDVTRDGDVPAVVEKLRQQSRGLDVVVANAGFGVSGKLEKLKLEDYQRQFETNIFGVLRTIYGTLSALEQRKGSLALVGSVAGYVALPGASAYSMSKFAVRALAESIRPELARKGVAVTLISPGFVESEIRRVDNLGKLQPPTPDPVPSWMRMPAEDAARVIVRAIANRKAEEIVTFHGKVFVFIQRHFPGLVRLAQKFGVRNRPEPGKFSEH